MVAPFNVSPVFEWNYKTAEHIIINQGGTSAGKTYSILQVLILKAMERPRLVVSVVGQDMPNLRAGAVRELEKIFAAPFFAKMLQRVNRNECIFYLNNGSFIEFKSYDNEQDARNGKRDYLFINEANGLTFEIFEQLQVRTEYQTFIDYNPSAPFWVHSQLLGRAGVVRFIWNYTHNGYIKNGAFVSNLSPRKIANIEAKRDRLEWWRVYGLGYTGKVSGVVFPSINWVHELPPPDECERTAYGLDFGYSNDPTALVRVSLYRGELWAEGLLYETGLKYPQIAEAIIKAGVDTQKYFLMCDNDNRAIDTFKDYGIFAEAAKKGAGSILQGIETVKSYKLNILHSLEWKDEQLAYIYKKDRATGKPSAEPIDKHNHYFDALRYAMQAIHERRGGGGILATNY